MKRPRAFWLQLVAAHAGKREGKRRSQSLLYDDDWPLAWRIRSYVDFRLSTNPPVLCVCLRGR